MQKAPFKPANSVIVLDFETTGLSPDQGDRAIEIGAVKMVQGQITDRFQSLMNPGRKVPAFIESYTGISNHMLKTAPPCEEVMESFVQFAGDSHLVAHNASFDKRFLHAELQRLQKAPAGEFACSMLLARRLYQDAENHQLGTLVRHLNIANDGTFHRALADADMTAMLWLDMLALLQSRYQINNASFSFMQKLSANPKGSVKRLLQQYAASQ